MLNTLTVEIQNKDYLIDFLAKQLGNDLYGKLPPPEIYLYMNARSRGRDRVEFTFEWEN